MVALSWKTSATIENVASQPLVWTVDLVEIEVAIVAVTKVRDTGEDAIKELVD